jgi:formyl-CoA transferase
MFDQAERAALPLAGIRVLTVDNYFAGNYGPLLLALHGAEVVKIERPAGGDVLRRDPPFVGQDPPVAHGELRLMRDKSSLALDITQPAGRSVLDSLLAKADVFWTNLRQDSLEKSRLTYDDVKACNERIVYACLSGFGAPAPESPFSGVAAFDIVVQAAAGLMSRNADDDGVPQYNGVAIADQVSSLYCAFGVVLALLRRERTGMGAMVDVSMFDSMVALNEKTLTLAGMGVNELPARRSATNAPFGAYRASDGYVVIGVGGRSLWQRFCVAIERPDLLERSDLSEGVDRVRAEATVLRPIIEEWLSLRTVDEAVERLRAHDVPAGPVLDVDSDVLLSEARRRGVVGDAALPQGGVFPVVQSPVLIDDGGCVGAKSPAALGEDTDAILSGWVGAEPDQIRALRAQGIVA